MVRERAVLQDFWRYTSEGRHQAKARRSRQALNEIWMLGAAALWVPLIPMRG